MRNPLYYRAIAEFEAVQSGDWNDWNTWRIRGVDGELYFDGYIPEAGNDVVTNGFSVPLSTNSACKSIDNLGNIVRNGFQLTVNGVDQFIESLFDLPDNTFYLDLQDDAAYTEASGVVERVSNFQSIGDTFPNLVSNGDFAGGTTTDWTVSGSSSLSVVSGAMRVTNGGATTGGGNQTITGLTTGKRYYIKASAVGGTSSANTLTVRIPASTVIVTQVGAPGTNFYLTFIAPGTSIEVRLLNNSSTISQYTDWDNIEVYELDGVIAPGSTARPTKATAPDGKKYLLFDGTNDFMYGIGNAIQHSGFTKIITFEWDSSTAILADNHLIASLVNNQHSLSIVKTNSTTARVKDGLATSGQYDLLIDRLTGQRVTVIEVWGGGFKSIWLNGVKVVDSIPTSQTITDFSFLLGSFNNGAASTFFKGKVFEMATYDIILSDEDVSRADYLQQSKFRTPFGTHLLAAGVGESVEVGYATAQPSDPIISGAGLNYLPSLNLFRIANDVNGDGYSASLTGSKIPPLCDEYFSETGNPVLYVQTAKGGSTVSSVSASGDGTTHWGPDGVLRYNSLEWIRKMEQAAGASLQWLVINIGENDAIYMNSNPSWTKALFKAALQNIVDFYKEYLPGIKIILVQSMNQRGFPSDNIIYGAQTTLINEAQQEIVAENENIWLDTSPSTFTITNGLCMPDGQHYSKTGNKVVGEAQAQIMANN